nr:hypothetical protein GCM10020093_037310 [Planobispora longispora]
MHDARLLGLIDGWLTGLVPEAFVDVLPLLRRTFGAFAAPERRSIGERVRSLGGAGPPPRRPRRSTRNARRRPCGPCWRSWGGHRDGRCGGIRDG